MAKSDPAQERAAAPELKHIFDAARMHHLAEVAASASPGFDAERFLRLTLQGLDARSLMERLHSVSLALYESLPAVGYRKRLALLFMMAPRINNRFVTLALPDYVARYGLDDFDASMEALRVFTPYGSSEFGVRPFLRQDMARGLPVLQAWAKHADEHVRRLASEGSRPRLPWSFRLDALVADPAPTRPVLESLRADDSLYVRKSVANHLNDIAKDHPDWLFDVLEGWRDDGAIDDARTQWIVRHGLRTLVKRGEPRALGLLGAQLAPRVRIEDARVAPSALSLGDTLTVGLTLVSADAPGAAPQRVVVDYAVSYVKKNGAPSRKVFKLKTLDLPAAGRVTLSRRQVVKDYSTRKHYAGVHGVELLVNGACVARSQFVLAV